MDALGLQIIFKLDLG